MNLLIAYLCFSNGLTMIKREKPYLNSVEMQIPVGGTPEETAEVMKTEWPLKNITMFYVQIAGFSQEGTQYGMFGKNGRFDD